MSDKKQQAQAWFRDLRDRIVARFEGIEAAAVAAPALSERESSRSTPDGRATQKFTITPWDRPEGGGGEMGMMKGKVFEKVGVNISTVTGEFSEAFRKEIPGASADPRFWASGISLVAHLASPKVPAAHFNTRMIVVGDEARVWFGGGGDLNPMVEHIEDTRQFHTAFREACAPFDAQFYPAFKAWCDEYFFLPHRNETRGVGGIFYDYLGLNTLGTAKEKIASGQFGKGGAGKEKTARGMEVAANADLDWQRAFDFTKGVGEAFLQVYPAIIEARMHEPFTEADREHQLRKRGRYAEYNLLYDRGTRFGLMTGGNPEAILMSLPPIAKWD